MGKELTKEQLKAYRNKIHMFISNLTDIVDNKMLLIELISFDSFIILFFDEEMILENFDDNKFKEKWHYGYENLKSISEYICDEKVRKYYNILKENFDDYNECVNKVQQQQSAYDFMLKIFKDLENFVNAFKENYGYIMEGDTKAKLFNNNLLDACKDAGRNNRNLHKNIQTFCNELVKIIKSRQKSSIISKITSKSSPYLKDIIKNAEKLGKSIINKPNEKDFDNLIDSIQKAIDAGKKMKQRRKEHYPILSYPAVQEAFGKVIDILESAKEQIFNKNDVK